MKRGSSLLSVSSQKCYQFLMFSYHIIRVTSKYWLACCLLFFSSGGVSIPGHASSATRELDELMDSLSQFKVIDTYTVTPPYLYTFIMFTDQQGYCVIVIIWNWNIDNVKMWFEISCPHHWIARWYSLPLMRKRQRTENWKYPKL